MPDFRCLQTTQDDNDASHVFVTREALQQWVEARALLLRAGLTPARYVAAARSA